MTPPTSKTTRRRLIALWSGFGVCAALCLLLALAWLASLRWTTFLMAQFGDSLGLRGGTVFYLWSNADLRQRLHAQRGVPLDLSWQRYVFARSTAMEWLPKPYEHTSNGRHCMNIPLWAPWLVSAAGAAWLWRALPRRHGATRCPSCGYDRAGLELGVVCPECGSEPSSGPYPLAPAE